MEPIGGAKKIILFYINDKKMDFDASVKIAMLKRLAVSQIDIGK
jgi:hypothetical protein